MSEILIVDASIGIAMVRGEPEAPRILDSLMSHRRLRRHLLAPSIFWLEVVNVVRLRYRGSGQEMTEAVLWLERIGIGSVEASRSLLLMTIDVMERHRLTSYDATYLALATALDGQLMTGDRALADAAGDRAILVGAGDRLSETRAAYGSDQDALPGWPGAATSLRLLRPRTPPIG
jgi:predicted nucleic acid-binding protein